MDGHHPHLSPHHPMGHSEKTPEAHHTSITYINWYLREVDTQVSKNLNQLTSDRVEGGHLVVLIDTVVNWLAHTQLLLK
jgi:hypothetical protein